MGFYYYFFPFFPPLKWRPPVAELPVYSSHVPDGQEKSNGESGVRIQGCLQLVATDTVVEVKVGGGVLAVWAGVWCF